MTKELLPAAQAPVTAVKTPSGIEGADPGEVVLGCPEDPERSLPRLAVDRRPFPRQSGPLPDAADAKGRLGDVRRVEADAPILDLNPDLILLLRQSDFHLAALAVPASVRHAFLDDAKTCSRPAGRTR